MNVKEVARLCHKANSVYCEIIGDRVPMPWALTDQDRIIDGVNFVLQTPGVTPKQVHDHWMETMHKAGWHYGLVKDYACKISPALIPFGQQPEAQRMKDRLFIGIVNACRGGCCEPFLMLENVLIRARINMLQNELYRTEKMAEARGLQLSRDRPC